MVPAWSLRLFLCFTLCFAADRERIVLGTEDGLFVVEVTRDGETEQTTRICLRVLIFFNKAPGSVNDRVGFLYVSDLSLSLQ